MADELLKEGVYVIGFSYPVCRMVKREFARKCQQIQRENNWIVRLLLLLR